MSGLKGLNVPFPDQAILTLKSKRIGDGNCKRRYVSAHNSWDVNWVGN